MANPNDIVGRPRSDIMPSNSLKSKSEIEAIKASQPTIKKREDINFTIKKNPWRKFFKGLFVDDKETIGEFIINDVMRPSIRKLIFDVGAGALEMALYGSVSASRRGGAPTNATKVSYNAYYQNGGQRRPEPESNITTSWRDVTFDTRPDGDKILFDMMDILADYPSVSVANLNEMLGITGPYTDANWGWTDLSNASVKLTRDGYILDLPKPRPL